jgi:hypothetical protein
MMRWWELRNKLLRSRSCWTCLLERLLLGVHELRV